MLKPFNFIFLCVLLTPFVVVCVPEKRKSKKALSKNIRLHKKYTDTLQVTASAYTIAPAQDTSTPSIGAWGDTLSSTDKVIAVSRDLLQKGLPYNTLVKIKNFKGVYRVRDKMSSRWTNRIDILMGEDVQKAREFGVREVEIYVINPDRMRDEE